MGTPIEEEKGGNAGASMFDRVIAMRMKKRIEEAALSVIDDFEFDDDSFEAINDVMTEILNDPKLKARIKTKVSETLDEDKLVDKIAAKIVNQLLKA
jgi:hypothetical protein